MKRSRTTRRRCPIYRPAGLRQDWRFVPGYVGRFATIHKHPIDAFSRRWRWLAVHALDAAVLFRLALGPAPAGTAWHAVADEGDAVRDIATLIGRRLQLPVESVPEETYGPFGPIFATDQPSSSVHTRATLGWQPTHPSLLTDLEHLQP